MKFSSSKNAAPERLPFLTGSYHKNQLQAIGILNFQIMNFPQTKFCRHNISFKKILTFLIRFHQAVGNSQACFFSIRSPWIGILDRRIFLNVIYRKSNRITRIFQFMEKAEKLPGHPPRSVCSIRIWKEPLHLWPLSHGHGMLSPFQLSTDNLPVTPIEGRTCLTALHATLSATCCRQ